jgi:hypothetical protein
MPDMSPEEQLRRLEEEVDREREAAKKKREELAQKALTPIVVEKPAETLPAKKVEDESTKALVTDADANAWKRGLQKKIALGAGGVMVAYWLMSNVLTIIGGAAVVAGAYYLSGRYLSAPPEQPDKKKKDAPAD